MGNTCHKRTKLLEENKENFIYRSSTNFDDTESYKEYFKLIRYRLRRFYEENQNNQFNISLCLDKKDFNSTSSAKKISINPSQKFIYWKDYLLNYLNKQQNRGFIWASELIDSIKSEIFLSENKWLSLFFWQEFEMRTKPKCLQMRVNEHKDSSNTDDNRNSMLSITDRLNGSFVSINTSTLSIGNPTHEYKEYRQKVKSYMNVFKEHVFDIDHPINIVAKSFVRVFSNFINERIKELYSIKNSELEDFHKMSTLITDEIIKCFQKFIIKLQTALRLMYSKTINYQCFIEEKDEFINLITNLIFKEGEMYNKMYELFEVSLYDQVKVLEGKLNELKHTKPEDLGIHEKFCLNEVTFNFQKKLIEDDKINLKSESEEKSDINFKKDYIKKIEEKIEDKKNFMFQESYSDNLPCSNVTMKLNIRSSLASHDKEDQINLYANTDVKLNMNNTKHAINIDSSSTYKGLESEHKTNSMKVFSESSIMHKSLRKEKEKNKFRYSQGSYEAAIKLLKSINKYKVPFEKMMLLATISSEVTECVNNFWADMSKVVTSSLLNIDADELMTIFIYVIIKSQMAELLIHSKLIKEFTTSTTRSTMIGYYYTTVEASLIYILSISDKTELFNREKIRNSLVPNRTTFIDEEVVHSNLVINNQI